jgi:2-amino-4-hydroxy-6-hydroxymethyldihydropteridine diphosphokinase
VVAYLGLGSNVGDRLAHLRAAVDLLQSSDDVRVVSCSSVYETDPVGEILDQRDFYNAVVAVETELEAHALLDACKRIERQLGREPGGPRHAPRPIDVDLLIADDLAVADERLVLPHPELANRRFVLTPLAEIEPGLALPDGRTVEQALATLEDQRVNRVEELRRS